MNLWSLLVNLISLATTKVKDLLMFQIPSFRAVHLVLDNG